MTCRHPDCTEPVADSYGPLLCLFHRVEAIEADIIREQEKLRRRRETETEAEAMRDWDQKMQKDEDQIREAIQKSWQQ